MTEFYGKREARIVAGVAVVMMMAHHFFGFADYRLEGNWFYEPVSVAGISVERMVAAFGKLCVAIFAFSSGYAIWKMQRDYISYKSRFLRIGRFLISYWIIAVIFLIYGCCVGDILPDIKALCLNAFGLATMPSMPYVNVTFAC